MAEYTPEQIEEMRAAVAAADAAKVAAQAAARAAYIAPVKNLLDSDEFKTVEATLRDLHTNFAADGNFSIHLDAVVNGINGLSFVVTLPINPPAPAPEGNTDEPTPEA